MKIIRVFLIESARILVCWLETNGLGDGNNCTLAHSMNGVIHTICKTIEDIVRR